MHFAFLFFLTLLLLPEGLVAAAVTPTEYVGRAVCTECHQKQATQWLGSHHDQAMAVAERRTVLGDFDNASLTHFGVTSSFYQKDGKFMVRTDGPDGKLQDYEVKYTFGVNPLQQYLIEFPDGRLQALSLAWDTRPKDKGGQRWFHLYPDEQIRHDDELHWTGANQNWNYMCAECHSTELKKNYDAITRTFSTTWSEINVSCEACHGPGSEHVTWAKREPGWEKRDVSKGLTILLDERRNMHWTIDAETGNAARSTVRSSDKEIEMCARCHSRRIPISTHYAHGEPLLDHYMPQLLDEGSYHADGQIDDEVYVYGSFIQSKMYQAGVTCSDCHEPHSLDLRAPGNGVCLSCHQAGKYDQASHHFHEPGSRGASCAECHMPPRTYMVVDPRHDHSMRIPRPDLSVKLGTPNACTNCHGDQSAEWAASQVKRWYGGEPKEDQRYAEALAAGRSGKPSAGSALTDLIRDPEIPDIARATALTEIAPYVSSPATIDALTLGLSDDNPSLRVAALRALENAPTGMRIQLAFPALHDPVRAVRIEAARVLASIPADNVPTNQRSALKQAQQEYVAAEHASAERPEAQMNLGNFYAAKGNMAKAVSAYRTAVELNAAFAPGYVNMADLYRSQGNEAEAEKVLRQALEVIPRSADVHYALGLSLVRQKRPHEALEALRLAATLDPGDAHYVYAYAVALNSTGNPKQAIMVLQGAHTAHPHNIEILKGLMAFHRDMGNQEAARLYADKLRTVSP